jgi:hypothetical protein
MRHLLRACVAMTAAIVVGLIAGGAGAGAAATTNLLQDPGAEQGGYSAWDTRDGFAIEQYGAENRPDASVGAAINGGANFFAGGSDSTVSTAVQDVDVSTSAKAIDGGTVTAQLGAYLGGYGDEDDYAEVTADFLPAASDTPLASLKIGPVTAADRGQQTEFLPRSGTAAVPASTRRIRVTITSTRLDGVYTDGYADNLTLTLSGPSIGATPTPTATPAPPRPGKVGGVKVKGKRVKGRVQAKAPCKSGRKVVLKKGSKTLAQAKSKASGKFTLKKKKAKKGKLVIKVRKRTISGVVCKGITRPVPGRH